MKRYLLTIAILCTSLLSGCTATQTVVRYVDLAIHPRNPLVVVNYFDANGNITRREWKRLCDVTDCGKRRSKVVKRWKSGDEAITRHDRERVTLIRRVKRLTDDGYNWLVRLSVVRAGHPSDVVEFQVYEGNLKEIK